ncbi:MAG: hypothetical protein Q8S92_14755 [Hydrogenophaga sp.]|uniref:hypothetical protein n=1 Tax=Hydrogenophaga sp. TaxID=1904254 RepID=UPI002732BCC3|nr:hypothetical protein [Hydrogenophaga sp.]MDP3350249.1 hypothetical protein [Hydrogenophaga sp.]
MAKTPSHITPLTVELPPAKSSTQLISEYVERLRDSGVRQKVVALTLGFKPN